MSYASEAGVRPVVDFSCESQGTRPKICPQHTHGMEATSSRDSRSENDLLHSVRLHWASTSSDGASPFVPSPRTLLTNCTLEERVAASSAPQGHVIGGGASLPVESLHLSTAAVKSTQRGKPKPARVRVATGCKTRMPTL